MTPPRLRVLTFFRAVAQVWLLKPRVSAEALQLVDGVWKLLVVKVGRRPTAS